MASKLDQMPKPDRAVDIPKGCGGCVLIAAMLMAGTYLGTVLVQLFSFKFRYGAP